MKRIHRSAAGLLALAAWLAITGTPTFALTRATPLEAAQDREALTSGGYFDPGKAAASAAALADQRDARAR